MEKIYFGVDVGGSLTKDVLLYDGEEIFRDKNNYVIAHDGYIKTRDYILDDKDYSSMLDLTIKIDSKAEGDFRLPALKIVDEINSTRWLLGRLAKSVSTNATKIPLGMKVKQSHYYLNIIGALVTSMEEVGLREAKVVLGTLLPAKQYFQLEKEMVMEILGSKIEVTNNLTDDKFFIEIVKDESEVKPEAVVAFSYSLIKNGKITDLGKNIIDKFNIAIDIGENTTDIAGIRDRRPDPSTFHSFDFAGSLLLQYLSREISRKYDSYDPPLEDLRVALSTGFLPLGINSEWVGEEISIANKEFATRLFTEFTQYYLLNKDIKLPQIASFLFIGGGSVEIEKVVSVRSHFMSLVKDTSKFTSSFSPEDIRKANIKGLSEVLKAMKRNSTRVR